MARRPLFNRLAFKIALAVAGSALTFGFISALLSRAFSWQSALFLTVVAGLAAYVAAHALVARRLELARKALREARKRRFDALSTLSHYREEDELDALVYQTYRAGRALQNEIERLERLEDYRREYLGDVSHELRTPIFAVSGFAETLLDGAIEDEEVRRRFVEKIHSNAQRLDALTRDLAEISRIETGELQMSMKSFDLAELMRETTEALELQASDRGISLTVQNPTKPLIVKGDRERLGQVLANLVENAIKYNEPGGRVEMLARPGPNQSVRISVVDDGIGIPTELIPRLTERFYRVDKSRSREQGGTGLGLAIVKHILEAHDTRLQVESKPGYGSTFMFDLKRK